VLFREHRGHSSFRERLREIPKRMQKGDPKPKRRAEPAPTSAFQPIQTDDVEMWLAKLARLGPKATSEMAQELIDAVSKYIDHLLLTPASGDLTWQRDFLGAKMHEILEKLKRIKFKMFAEAASADQTPNMVLVVGVEGAGKSTTLNALLKQVRMADTDLAAANSQSSVSQTFSKRFAHEADLDKSKIEAAEQELEAFVFNKARNKSLRYMKAHSGDLLPTGKGAGAMTALATMIKLSPETTVAVLKLTYRSRERVDELMDQADQIRRVMQQHEGEDDAELEQLFDFDFHSVAHMVCDMVGDADQLVTRSGDALDLLKKFDGPFRLKDHQYDLLGRQREIRVAAPSFEEMAAKVRNLLMMHTVGTWSNWAILTEVELILPAQIALTLCDVPGFGSESMNPFRQSIVQDAVENCECSTLLFCLKYERVDGDNAKSAAALEEAGVCEQLFGEEIIRKIGHLHTSISLDWALKETLEDDDDDPALQVYAEEANAWITKSEKWLKGALKQAAHKKGVDDKRVEAALAKYTKSFAPDVLKVIEKRTESDAHSIQLLVDQLVANSNDSLHRRQMVLFQSLVVECLLPFFYELEKTGKFREFGALPQHQEAHSEGTAHGIKKPTLKRLLTRLKEAGDQALILGGSAARVGPSSEDGPRRSVRGLARDDVTGTAQSRVTANARSAHEANSLRAKAMESEILRPKCDAVTETSVKDRYERDGSFNEGYFEEYRRHRSRALGLHLKSQTIERTLLKDLIMPEVANDSVLPVIDHLSQIKNELIFAPLEAMTHEVIFAFTDIIDKNRGEGAQPQKLQTLEALTMLIIPSLGKWRLEQQQTFDMLFSRLLQTLPHEKDCILKQEFDQSLKPVGVVRGNAQKKNHLAKKANAVALEVSRSIGSYVLSNILDVMHARLHKSLESICKSTYAMFCAAVDNGEIKDLERLEAFTTSQHYARLCAGIVAAVSRSGLIEELLKEYELQPILDIAAQPAGLLNKGEGLDTLFPDQPMDDSMAVYVPASDADASSSATSWQCPCCGVDISQTNASAISSYPIRRPCHIDGEGCWCQAEESRDKTYCKLCVDYFKKKHLPRPPRLEKKRTDSIRRKRSGMEGLASPPTSNKVAKPWRLALLDPPPSPSSASVVSL